VYKIRKHDKIAEIGLAELPSSWNCSTDEKNPDGIILRSYKLQASEFGESLLAVGRAGAGVNNIPVAECTQKGIVVFNTPGANANAVKELTVAALLLSSRRLVESVNALKAIADHDDIDKKAEKLKGDFAGPELAGKTLGIVGLGAIGVLVSQAAVGLDMKVVGYDPGISVQNAWNIPREVKQATSLESLVAECDYLTVHVPLVDATKNLINAGLLAKMKAGIRLVNLSRAEIMSVPDVLEAMNDGKVASLATDFADSRLLNHPKVLTFPHMGASTPEAEDNCAVLACAQVRDFLVTGNIRNSVNFPSAHLEPKADGKRVAILHKNVPKMLATISEVFGNHNLNIADMVNASKGEVAYTMLDVDGNPDAALAKELGQIAGVMKVRVLSRAR
jgi:D-3-phosphoglycerate dehydrogenase